MNEELQKQLSGVIGSITEAVTQAKDFTLAQLPDVASSYVAYGRAYATACLLISLLCVGAGIFCFVSGARMNRKKDRASKDVDAAYDAYSVDYSPRTQALRDEWIRCKKVNGEAADGTARMFAGGIAAVISAISTQAFASMFFMTWLAPKVWLIKELVHLVK